jgi:hypothetical protein
MKEKLTYKKAQSFDCAFRHVMDLTECGKITFVYFFPVNYVPKCFNISWTFVLIVKIVCMFPYI